MTTKDVNKVLNDKLNAVLFEVHTILPGKFQSYEGHSTRKAKVQPLIKLRDNKNNILNIDPIDNVPVIFPSSGKFNLLFPISSGDGCLLLFSEASIGNFLNGQSGQIVDADNWNKFELNDCIAIPGLWNYKSVPTSASNSIEITDAGKIDIKGTTVDILGATESFMKGDTWKSAYDTFMNVLATITPGNEAANATALGQIKSAAIAILTQHSSILSSTIKGE